MYIATETLVRALLAIAIIDLALLGPALWYLWKALWKAGDVLTRIDINYQVERDMRKWRVQQYAKEQQEASLNN